MRTAWNKGLTKETDARVKKCSESGRINKSKSHLGLRFSKEHCENISLSLRGIKKSEEHKTKLSLSIKRAYITGKLKRLRKENNPAWKGDKAGYASFHFRVERIRGKPKKCEVCFTEDINKTYEWASLTKNYPDIMDYKRMCKSCHNKFDGIGLWNRSEVVNRNEKGQFT